MLLSVRQLAPHLTLPEPIESLLSTRFDTDEPLANILR